MRYSEAKSKVEELRERFDEPYSEADKRLIEQLHSEVLGKDFKPTSCQQCYHDAVIIIYTTLKRNKKMAKKCNYRLRAGFIISCPDFNGGRIYTNDNLTDKVAKAYLDKYPKMETYFQQMPSSDDDDDDVKTKDPGPKPKGGDGNPLDNGEDPKNGLDDDD